MAGRSYIQNVEKDDTRMANKVNQVLAQVQIFLDSLRSFSIFRVGLPQEWFNLFVADLPGIIRDRRSVVLQFANDTAF